MIDFTNTMELCMEAVKLQLTHFLENVRNRFPESEIRVSLVGYRDLIDREKRFVIKDFSIDPAEISSVLETEKAEGGGDIPEDVLGALLEVKKLNWQSERRVLVHITDAPCHGANYHDFKDDIYPYNDAAGYDDQLCEEILSELNEKGVRYLLITKNSRATDKMALVFRDALEDRGFSMEYCAIDNVGQDPEKIFDLIERFVFTSLRSADETD